VFITYISMVIKVSKEEKNKVVCPVCKSENTIKWTKRQTQNRGLIQRYKCKNCGKYFTKDEGFFRMRNNAQKITSSIDLFFNGLSTRKVQAHLKAFFPHNASNVSVYNWVIKYSKKISKFTDSLKLNVGHELQVDEQSHNRMGNQNWLIDSIDTKTRFLVASNFRKARSQIEIKEVLEIAKYKTQGNITTITTDGWKVYTKLVKHIFGYYNFQRGDMFHNVKKGCDNNGFNVPIERFHNNVRDRTKIMRGFHGSVESADTILRGFVIYYNFIRKHQGINCSPYELATNIKLGNPNKWLELIEMAEN